MGNFCMKREQADLNKLSERFKQKYTFLHYIGKGSYGRVRLIQSKRTKKLYAIKIFDKFQVANKDCIQKILVEKKIIQQNRNNFLVRLFEAFQDKENLYLVMTYMPFGNLRRLMFRKKTFTEPQVKFLTICLLLGLEQLRKKNVIHRDLKPQNILIDSNSFRICDFSSSLFKDDSMDHKANGTKGYMSPQMIKGEEQDFTSDYYSLGVVITELVYGHKIAYSKVKQKDIDRLFGNDGREEVSEECKDFIKKLTQTDPEKRIGKNSMHQFWVHPWLMIDKNKRKQYYEKKKQLNPFFPMEHKLQPCKHELKAEQQKTDKAIAKMLLLQSQKFQDLFQDFSYFNVTLHLRN